MKTLAIPVTIAPALKGELFDSQESVRDNKMYFIYKPWKEKYYGPFYTHEGCDEDYIVAQFTAGMIYTLAYGSENGFSFQFILRTAHADDLKNGKKLRAGHPYYIREDQESVDGPFELNTNTDVELLAKHLRIQAIYVPNEAQNFTPFDIQHSA